VAAAVRSASVLAEPAANATPAANAPMPTIKLGNLPVSRLILGSNPFFGFAHGNPQASSGEMKEFYTPERVMAVLDGAAEQGITAVWTPCYDHWIKIWTRYQEQGGKLKIWIAQPDRQPMLKELDTAIKHGAKAVCIQGIQVDTAVGQGKWETLREWIDHIHEHGLPAGIATHKADTHLRAEDRKLPTDFYHQTLYRPDNYVPAGLEESLATIEKLEKPVVAYKVLGAGRIKPQDTLPVILKRLKPKDGLCVGVFPRKNQAEIVENVTLVAKHSSPA
jgi:hypothetical protein